MPCQARPSCSSVCSRSPFKTCLLFFFFFSSRRRHTRLVSDWSSDVCSSDLPQQLLLLRRTLHQQFQKPVDLDHLKLLVQRAAQQQELLRENLLLREEYATQIGRASCRERV